MTEPARATKKTTSKASTRTAKAAPATARCPLLLQKDERGASESAYIFLVEVEASCNHITGVEPNIPDKFFLNTHYIFLDRTKSFL